MGGPFPSAKGSTQLSALPPTFVGGIFHNTKEFSLPQSSRPLTSAILHFMELMAYRATPKKWHRPQVVRSTTEDVPPGAAAPSGTLNRGRRTSGGRGPQWYAQPRKMYQRGPPPQDTPKTPQDSPGRPRTPQTPQDTPRTPQDAWGPKPQFWVVAQDQPEFEKLRSEKVTFLTCPEPPLSFRFLGSPRHPSQARGQTPKH